MKLFSDVLLDIFLKELDKKYKELSLSLEEDFNHYIVIIVINFLEKAYTLYDILKVNESLDIEFNDKTIPSYSSLKEQSEMVDLQFIEEEIELYKQKKKLNFNINKKVTKKQKKWLINNKSKIIKHLSSNILTYFHMINNIKLNNLSYAAQIMITVCLKINHNRTHNREIDAFLFPLFDCEYIINRIGIKNLETWLKDNKKTIVNVFNKYPNEITKEKLRLFYSNYFDKNFYALELPLEIYLNYVDKESWFNTSSFSVNNLYKKNLKLIVNKKRIRNIHVSNEGFKYSYNFIKNEESSDIFHYVVISNDLKDKEELYYRYLQHILFTSKYIYNLDFCKNEKEKIYIDNNLLKETIKQSYAYLLEGIKNLVKDELLSKKYDEKYYHNKVQQHKKDYPDERYGGPDAVIDTAIEDGILDKKFKKYFHYRDIVVDNLNEDIGYLFTKDCLFEFKNIFNALLKDKFDITVESDIDVFEKYNSIRIDSILFDGFFTEVRTGILLRQHIRYLKDDLHFLSKNVSIPGYDKKSGGLLNQRINPICAHNSNSNEDLLKIQNEPYPITSDPRFETTLDFLDQNKLLDNSIVSFKNIRNNAPGPEKQIAYLLLLQASVNKDVEGIKVLNMFNNGQKRIEYNTKLLEEKNRVEDILQNTNPSAIKNISTKNK